MAGTPTPATPPTAETCVAAPGPRRTAGRPSLDGYPPARTEEPSLPAHRCRLVVLLSGEGSLLQALLDACADPDMPGRGRRGRVRPCRTSAGSDRAGGPVCRRSSNARADHPDRAAWDAALLARVREHRPDLVVGAGFMKLLAPTFLDGIGCRMINSHPALLPAFPGAHAGAPTRSRRASTMTGATVHVVDAGHRHRAGAGPGPGPGPRRRHRGDAARADQDRRNAACWSTSCGGWQARPWTKTSPHGGPSDEMSGRT